MAGSTHETAVSECAGPQIWGIHRFYSHSEGIAAAVDDCSSLLIIEELLADGLAWEQATDSLRQEAVAMVTAIAADAVCVGGLRVSLLLSEKVAELLGQRRCLPTELRIVRLKCSLDTWLQSPKRQDIGPTQLILMIAPESGGVLVRRLQVLQSELWRGTETLNLPWILAETFADKFRTSQWLQARGLPTPETWLLSPEQAEALRTRGLVTAAADSDLSGEEWTAVLKPRDGVGCEHVGLLHLSSRELASVVNSSKPADINASWILQPWVPGLACSIGLIGGGAKSNTVILPAGRQTLRRHGAAVRYCGGEIPCETAINAAITPLAQALATAIGPFCGWLGADIVVHQNSGGDVSATIIEINPRLCTSYAGYRQLACGNLAEWLLQRAGSERVEWRAGVIRFGADGRARLDQG
jgi:predicted ATP-grasp superfamily ATP-dependent carboligase